MALRLAGTWPAQLGEGLTAGTAKSLPLRTTDALLRGPVTAPLSGIVKGPIAHDSPKRPVLPLTVAFRFTTNPCVEDPQPNVPVIVPGLSLIHI